MGKIGDVSGGVEGKIGDVSGATTLAELTDFLLQDRAGDGVTCLELRVSRLQNEVRGIARWLDLRMQDLEVAAATARNDLNAHEDALDEHEERLDRVDPPSGGGGGEERAPRRTSRK